MQPGAAKQGLGVPSSEAIECVQAAETAAPLGA